jgi:hypothetical protein
MKVQLCEMCHYRLAEHFHHLFPQTKRNKALYPEYIHHRDNGQFLCSICHLNKSVKHWSELEFCKHFGIKPRSKELLFKVSQGRVEKFWQGVEI